MVTTVTESSYQHGVIYVTNGLGAGGIERNIRVVSSNVGSEYRPEIWTTQAIPDQDELGIPVQLFRRKIRFDPITILSMRSKLKHNKASILHIYHFASGIHALLANLTLGRCRKKMIFSFGSARKDSRMISAFFSMAGKYGDWITGNSPYVLKGLQQHGVPESKMELLPNGHDTSIYVTEKSKAELRRHLKLPLNKKLIITTGRLANSKRICDLLDAIPLMSSKDEVHVAIVGDGPLRSELEKQTIQLNIRDQVTFAGHRSDVASFLLAGDVFVFPSETEGLPNSLIESSLAGLPIVACEAPGVVDVIRNEVNGLLVPIRSPDRLANATERILNDHSMTARFIAEAKETAQEKYCLNTVIQQVRNIYSRILDQSSE